MSPAQKSVEDLQVVLLLNQSFVFSTVLLDPLVLLFLRYFHCVTATDVFHYVSHLAVEDVWSSLLLEIEGSMFVGPQSNTFGILLVLSLVMGNHSLVVSTCVDEPILMNELVDPLDEIDLFRYFTLQVKDVDVVAHGDFK